MANEEATYEPGMVPQGKTVPPAQQIKSITVPLKAHPVEGATSVEEDRTARTAEGDATEASPAPEPGVD